MKLILSLFAITMTVISCSKSSNQPVSLVGKWSLINDSTETIYYGTLGKSSGTWNYIGTDSDCFNFLSDSTLYTKEGAQLDTANYSTQNNNQVTLINYYYHTPGGQSIKWHGQFEILKLTSNRLTLNLLPNAGNLDGNVIEVINLKK